MYATIAAALLGAGFQLEVRQLTFGPKHHFFGYIGHVKNIPWNGDGRYIVALRTDFQDRMPAPADAAEVVLIDTRRNHTVTAIDRTRGWNFQQGTMFYWNPQAPDTQLFFNDRDPRTNHVFTVLFDIARRKRIREFRYPGTPFGNSGVAQNGGRFLGLNYGRLARLRPVTGYPEAHGWTGDAAAPADDGIFLVDAGTGAKRLLVSYRTLAEAVKPLPPDDRIYFFLRADFDSAEDRLDIPCTIRSDGTGLAVHSRHIGGHPEWENGPRIVGTVDGRQVLYDVDRREVVETIGDPGVFPKPGGDVALSLDGRLLVNGCRDGQANYYVVFRRIDGAFARASGFSHPGRTPPPTPATRASSSRSGSYRPRADRRARLEWRFPMDQRISPARSISGSIALPGDKSISHRLAMLAAIAEGDSRIANYSTGADCQSTLQCLRALGVAIEKTGSDVVVHGQGLGGLKAPLDALDAGNSGSTIRMLSGILAAQPFTSRIGGDQSLSRRPMERIMRPLAEMGGSIRAREGKFPPLDIAGSRLRAIDYTLPVASAQVKTCVLFAGLLARGRTTVHEPVRTRDHTEIALREFGAGIGIEGRAVSVEGGLPLGARKLSVPGDLSSAAFFLAAALAAPESNLTIRGVGLNPTRSALLDFLVSMGGQIKILSLDQGGGELTGDLLVRHSRLRGGVIEKDLAAALIDEIPVLAVLGAISENGLTVRDAQELRVKETDRIATVADNLKRMGVEAEVFPDGLRVPGRQRFRAAEVLSHGDHRIAMAFAVAALSADGDTVIRDAEAAGVSFPEFFATLDSIAG